MTNPEQITYEPVQLDDRNSDALLASEDFPSSAVTKWKKKTMTNNPEQMPTEGVVRK